MSDKNSTRLSDFFSNQPLSAHGSKWSSLWDESYTPWDRGGPSLALYDVILSRADLIPPAVNLSALDDPERPANPPMALVPGCGRGHDVLLLAAMGYDVVGLDFAPGAIKEAAENEQSMLVALKDGRPEAAIYRTREGVESRGNVTWVAGDFFDETWLTDAGLARDATFDLIFDYTFLCALPPSARPSWASRISSLLDSRTGRLVCLEFPSGKPITELGPPWGLSADLYLALLARPGEDLALDKDGAPQIPVEKSDAALERLELIKPARTHRAGTNEDGTVRDWLHVWKHAGRSTQAE